MDERPEGNLFLPFEILMWTVMVCGVIAVLVVWMLD
jgi:hypothetical protein